MANGNQLPEGFILDEPVSSPGLPPGFVLDTPVSRETVAEKFARNKAAIKDQTLWDRANEAIMSVPGANTAMELITAVNRGAVDLGEFLTTDQINNIAELAGQGRPVPTIEEAIPGAVTGDYMEPGLLREAVQTGGELVAPGAAIGAGLRGVASTLPKLSTASEGLLPAVTRQLGGGTAASDVIGAGLAGAGMETGGEIGETLGGETGRQVGEMAGAIIAPLSPILMKETGKRLITDNAKALLKKSAPSIDSLKQAARTIYNDIDNTGAVVNSRSVDRLSAQLRNTAKREGFNRRIHPKVSAALDEFDLAKGLDQPVTELDTLRKVAQSAASSMEPSEKRLGTILINRIDDFMDDLAPKDFKRGGGDIGAKYKDARQLWSRAKKSELIEDAFSKARLQASGFENGIRTQFRSILNNKKKSRGFSPSELDAMRKVVKGGSLENMAKMLGRFGFSEGQASNMLMGSLGVAGGAAVGGPAGAVAVPLVGQMSRGLAQKLTRNNAEAANTISRAGNKGLDIAKAYIKSIPAKERSTAELAELLMRPGVAIGKINLKSQPPAVKKLVSDAAYFAAINKKAQDEFIDKGN